MPSSSLARLMPATDRDAGSLLTRASTTEPVRPLQPAREAATALLQPPHAGPEAATVARLGAAVPRPAALSYTVSLVRTAQELAEVRELRGRAYGRVLPGLGEHFAQADPLDEAPGMLVFAARDKASGRLIGSSRMRSNRHEPLPLQASVALPSHLQGRHLAEITRYVADAESLRDAPQRGLLKAMVLAAQALQIRAFVIAARDKMVRRYKALGLELLMDGQSFPMAHIGDLPHCVMAFDMVESLRRLRETQHPISAFIEEDWHPDVQAPAQLAAHG